ncbi:hypothetical protein VAE151_130019 [Vibrio aestuarianus]|nr:hypothetical protein VAE151_130019 [Vibrio aestuarianus]
MGESSQTIITAPLSWLSPLLWLSTETFAKEVRTESKYSHKEFEKVS